MNARRLLHPNAFMTMHNMCMEWGWGGGKTDWGEEQVWGDCRRGGSSGDGMLWILSSLAAAERFLFLDLHQQNPKRDPLLGNGI